MINNFMKCISNIQTSLLSLMIGITNTIHYILPFSRYHFTILNMLVNLKKSILNLYAYLVTKTWDFMSQLKIVYLRFLEEIKGKPIKYFIVVILLHLIMYVILWLYRQSISSLFALSIFFVFGSLFIGLFCFYTFNYQIKENERAIINALKQHIVDQNLLEKLTKIMLSFFNKIFLLPITLPLAFYLSNLDVVETAGEDYSLLTFLLVTGLGFVWTGKSIQRFNPENSRTGYPDTPHSIPQILAAPEEPQEFREFSPRPNTAPLAKTPDCYESRFQTAERAKEMLGFMNEVKEKIRLLKEDIKKPRSEEDTLQILNKAEEVRGLMKELKEKIRGMNDNTRYACISRNNFERNFSALDVDFYHLKLDAGVEKEVETVSIRIEDLVKQELDPFRQSCMLNNEILKSGLPTLKKAAEVRGLIKQLQEKTVAYNNDMGRSGRFAPERMEISKENEEEIKKLFQEIVEKVSLLPSREQNLYFKSRVFKEDFYNFKIVKSLPMELTEHNGPGWSAIFDHITGTTLE